jgi:serine/threonine protein kinase
MSASTFADRDGRSYAIECKLSEGAQGQTFLVRRRNDGQRAVLKLFGKAFRNDATRRRIARLVKRRLSEISPLLCAPVAMVDGAIGLGHVAPHAAGASLDSYLEAPTGSFLDHLIAAAAIAAELAVLENFGIGHGDLQAGNVIVEHRDGLLRARLIDFDNLIDPEFGCPCAGHPTYYAPEIRQAVAERRPARPDLASDRYAIGVLMHELLLARHPAARFVEDPATFDRAMRANRWSDDPAGSGARADDGGFRAEALDPPLLNLLRRALAGPRVDRPAAIEWFTALRRACDNVYVCRHCRYPCVVDGGKFSCVQCHKLFPAWRLTANGRTVATVQRGAVTIGRDDLGGDPRVSRRHAVLRRSGPDVLLEPRGPTYRVEAKGLTALAANREHRLSPGERIMFGSVEARLELAAAS